MSALLHVSGSVLLTVNGLATLGGTLTVDLSQIDETELDGYTVTILNATRITGTFDSIVVSGQWDCVPEISVSYLENSVRPRFLTRRLFCRLRSALQLEEPSIHFFGILPS